MAEKRLSLKDLQEQIVALGEKIVPSESSEVNTDEIVEKVKNSIREELKGVFEDIYDKLNDAVKCNQERVSEISTLRLEFENFVSVSGRGEGVKTNDFFHGGEEQSNHIFDHAGKDPVDQSGAPLPQTETPKESQPIFQVP